MKNPNPWSRVNRIYEYCDTCKNKELCVEWCFGTRYEQSSSKLIKRGLLDRFLQWIRGDKNES